LGVSIARQSPKPPNLDIFSRWIQYAEERDAFLEANREHSTATQIIRACEAIIVCCLADDFAPTTGRQMIRKNPAYPGRTDAWRFWRRPQMRTADDLFGGSQGSPRTDRVIATSIQWAEKIMEKIDGRHRE
jgi:hypothetical protein